MRKLVESSVFIPPFGEAISVEEVESDDELQQHSRSLRHLAGVRRGLHVNVQRTPDLIWSEFRRALLS